MFLNFERTKFVSRDLETYILNLLAVAFCKVDDDGLSGIILLLQRIFINALTVYFDSQRNYILTWVDIESKVIFDTFSVFLFHSQICSLQSISAYSFSLYYSFVLYFIFEINMDELCAKLF